MLERMVKKFREWISRSIKSSWVNFVKRNYVHVKYQHVLYTTSLSRTCNWFIPFRKWGNLLNVRSLWRSSYLCSTHCVMSRYNECKTSTWMMMNRGFTMLPNIRVLPLVHAAWDPLLRYVNDILCGLHVSPRYGTCAQVTSRGVEIDRKKNLWSLHDIELKSIINISLLEDYREKHDK